MNADTGAGDGIEPATSSLGSYSLTLVHRKIKHLERVI